MNTWIVWWGRVVIVLVLITPPMTTTSRSAASPGDYLIVTIRGKMTIQGGSAEPQVFEIARSFFLAPANTDHRTATYHLPGNAGSRVTGQLDLAITLLPSGALARVDGAATLWVTNRRGIGEISAVLPVDIPALAAGSERTLVRTMTDGRSSLELDLTVSSQVLACAPDIDADCDTLPDDLERFLIEHFKPMMVFAENEPVPPDEIAAVYQVSPKVLGIGGPVEVMITIVMLYTHDRGVYKLNVHGWNHITCNMVVISEEIQLGRALVPIELLEMPINAHCGDSETLRLLVSNTGQPAAWTLDTVYLKQHDDPWQTFCSEEIDEACTLSLDPAEGSRLVLYVSSAKHSIYPDPVTCEEHRYIQPVFGLDNLVCAFTFEECGTANETPLTTPPAHNVGERHRPAFDLMADSDSPILRRLFPGEYTWTRVAFCGGCQEIFEPAYGMGASCAGSLASKWWPPAAP